MQGRVLLWTIVGVLLAVIAGGVLFSHKPQFHPYVVFHTTESLQVVFLQHARRTAAECEATGTRIADAMLANCSICRLAEKRCLDSLDPRQRKILLGHPVDVPVMHSPQGAIAFLSSSRPELAQAACREAERQTSDKLSAECTKAGPDGIALSLAKISGSAEVSQMPMLHALLGVVLLAVVVSLLVCSLIIRSQRLHGRFSHDLSASGPQKFHAAPTPRIGGLAIAAGLAASVLALEAFDWLDPAPAYGLAMLALSAIPAFAAGFGEDITRKVGVSARLTLTFAAGVFASLLVDATLDRVDVPGFDTLLEYWPIFAIAFTAFAVGGIANAVNIIDGYNGLAGGYSILVLAALAWVAGQVGDPVVLTASVAMLGALLGFLPWNYPGGRIFMGDGGTYLLGFWLAELSVLLVVRNPDVSPWFPLVLLAYPVFETLFSIYRKMYVRGAPPGRPDRLHLHMLIYKRLIRLGSKDRRERTRRNSLVAHYVWLGTGMFILPSLLVWRDTAMLVALALAFSAGYVFIYHRLVQLRAPTWMIISPKKGGT